MGADWTLSWSHRLSSSLMSSSFRDIVSVLLLSFVVFADIKTDSVNVHNEIRARYGAAPLVWSDELAATAQAWANNCKFEHGGSNGAGQNLGFGQADVISLVNQFYAETDKYTDNKPDFAMETGHFTQVVWKDTKEVACAVQMSCPGGPLWVCHYFPPGNVIGQFAQQVTKGDTAYAPLSESAPPPEQQAPAEAVQPAMPSNSVAVQPNDQPVDDSASTSTDLTDTSDTNGDSAQHEMHPVGDDNSGLGGNAGSEKPVLQKMKKCYPLRQ